MRLRHKVVALLMSLVALWAFAAFVTLREGLNLLWIATLDQQLGRPTELMVNALQDERRLTLIYLGHNSGEARTALTAQRERTDDARSRFEHAARSTSARWAADAALESQLKDAFTGLEGLGRARTAIDTGGMDRSMAVTPFNDLIDVGFRIFRSNAEVDDQDIAQDGRTLIAMTRAKEILSREDALLAGIVAAGKFTGNEPVQFNQLVGAQRLLFAEAAAGLPSADLVRYRELTSGPAFSRFRAMEDLVIDRGRVGAPLPVDAASWQAAVDPVFAGVRDLVLTAGDGLVQRAKPSAIAVMVRLLLAGGLGLIAVIASIIVSITTGRALMSQLEKLRSAAWDLAVDRLPRVVEKLSNGEQVDVAVEAPPLEFGNDEIGQVGQAFNAVQRTAVQAAVDQAELRAGVRDVFLSLARRTQALVHRQLGMLDAMERRENNSEELEDLFRVDHLATRMRRNAENLIVLSGSVPGRGWRNPVPVVDVIRGAIAEVEEYPRCTLQPIADAAIVGRAVGDAIHLLAELIENAASYSPPYTTVNIGGRMVANGYAIDIEDSGLGMTESDLALANEQLRNPPAFNMSSTARLGLYVVGRLGERHGIQVHLRDSPYGGTTAIVLIPRSLIAGDPPPDAISTSGASGRTAIAAGVAAPAMAAPDNHREVGHSDVALMDSDLGRPRRPWSRRSASSSPRHLATDDEVEREASTVAPTFALDHAAWAPPDDPAPVVPAKAPPSAAVPSIPAARTPVEDTLRAARTPVEDTVRAARTPVEDTVRAARTPVEDTVRAARTPVEDTVPTGDGSTATAGPAALPRRVRQASLAPALRGEPAAAATPATDLPPVDATIRPPEQVRAMMAAYQSGTIRGRSDADRELAAGPVEVPLAAAEATPTAREAAVMPQEGQAAEAGPPDAVPASDVQGS